MKETLGQLIRLDLQDAGPGKKVALGVAIGAVVLAITVLTWVVLRGSSSSAAALAGDTTWQCTNKTCGNVFTLTAHEWADHQAKHYGEPVKCPKDGAPAVRVEKCPHCGAVIPAAGRYKDCPVCKKPLHSAG